MKKNKITVVGSGYVGMSLAVLLAQHNDVTVLDIDKERVAKVNAGQTTVADTQIEAFLVEKELCLVATQDAGEAFQDAGIVIVATPTNYDSETNKFILTATMYVNENDIINDDVYEYESVGIPFFASFAKEILSNLKTE